MNAHDPQTPTFTLLRLPSTRGAPLRLSTRLSEAALKARGADEASVHLSEADLRLLLELLRHHDASWSTAARTFVGGLPIDLEVLGTWRAGQLKLRFYYPGRKGSVTLSRAQAEALAQAIEARGQLEVDLDALKACGARHAIELATPQRMASVIDEPGHDGSPSGLCAVPCDIGTVIVETELLDDLITPVTEGRSVRLTCAQNAADWDAQAGVLTLSTKAPPMPEYEDGYDQMPRGVVRAPEGQRAWLLETLWQAADTRASYAARFAQG